MRLHHEVPAAQDQVRLQPALDVRSEEHTSELQSPCNVVCRLRLEKKKLSTNHDLREMVHGTLKDRLSRRQISLELHDVLSDNPEGRVSHEAIYRSTYVQRRRSTVPR